MCYFPSFIKAKENRKRIKEIKLLSKAKTFTISFSSKDFFLRINYFLYPYGTKSIRIRQIKSVFLMRFFLSRC